uniref:Polyketide synthase n=1 Tax=Alternaria alternantherae TaxID=1187899 RepID=A0A1C9HK82_9PLEO|nr:polyketide synthase [Alternaria alternantherae]
MSSIAPTDEPIAIIGTSCRFPGGCNTPSKLWELLRKPRDVVRPFDAKRFNLERFYHPDGETHGATDVKGKSYLLEEDNRLFDAGFFAISPVEAAGMDPQQRLLLETTYEACESAGITLEQLRGSLTSVHVGVMTNDYAVIQARDTETLPKYNATGTANSILSNRVSYIFDLKGPSATIDTACSSSLVALHHAVQGLRSGDSTMAVVGGTNLILEPTPYIAESKLHMLSPDSQSRMWDKTANGYARGEGIASLLLKPLSAAQRDGDPIEGVIRATGVNSDGMSPGITMPFAPSQAALIRHVYRRAGLDPMRDPPQYFECHGTGTQAGDPVEARAIFEAFYRDGETGEAKKEPQTMHVGSVKTVIGHLEGCAGLAGVIKVLLALKHQTIPPNMHFNELNPKITPYYGTGALVIPIRPLPWPRPPAGAPMRASVNSFGFGGTNAHVIIESLPGDEGDSHVASQDAGSGVVGPLLFSAASGPALLRNVQAHLAHLQANEDISLQDVSWVLQTRRTTHRVRASFAGATRQQLLASMAQFVEKHAKAGTKGGDIGSVARLLQPKEAPGTLGIFTGQGAQWATMGRELLHANRLFRQSLEACEAVLRDGLLPGDAPEWTLIEELTKEKGQSRVGEAGISQPLCTALQVALVDMLAAAGVKLDAVVGHSSGEIAATYAAGIISRRAAMQIAYYRGLYAPLCRGAGGQRGGMLAVGLSMEAAQRFCRQPAFVGRLVVAASNSPQSCTLSGDVDAVVEAKAQLDSEHTFARQLHVDTAYHSHHMQACADKYLRSLAACDIDVQQPRPECIWNSSVRGDTRLLGRGGDLASLKGPYWVANMVQTVKFSQAVESSIWHGGPWDLAVEIGPHAALKGPMEQTLKAAYGTTPRYTSLLQRNVHDVAAFQTAIGVIWAQLGPSHVDFAGYRSSFHECPEPCPSLSPILGRLPTYSWDHDKVYWRESRTSARHRTSRHGGHELLGRRVADDNERELRWRNVLKLSEMPWLRGHDVLGQVLLPGAAYVSLAAEAAQHLAATVAPGLSIQQISVEHVDLLRPLVVPDNQDGVETLFTAQVISADTGATAARPAVHARFAYYVCQNEAAGAMMHTCTGTLTIHVGHASEDASALPPRPPVPDKVVHVEREPVYDMFRAIGLNYTGAFDAITDSRRCLGYAAATAVWPSDSPVSRSHSQYILHPALLDVAFQSLFVAHVHPSTRKLTSALLPSHIDRVTINVNVPRHADDDAVTRCNFDAWVVSSTPTKLDGDITIYHAPSDCPFVQVEGLCTRSAGGGQSASLDKHIFLKTVHGHDASLGGLVLPPRDSTKDAHVLRANVALERLALFYIQRALDDIEPQERSTLSPSQQRALRTFEQHVETVRQDESPFLNSEWLSDDEHCVLIDRVVDNEHPDPDSLDLKLVHAVGAQLPQLIRGHTQLHDISYKAREEDKPLELNKYLPLPPQLTSHVIGQLLKQITFKFPRCNMLEIGTRLGDTTTTQSILDAVDNQYDSYTYTHASSDAFPIAAAELADKERIMYKALNLDADLEIQGFSSSAYHVVIAPHSFSTRPSSNMTLEETLQKARTLLCPGGYLVLSEITGMHSMVGSLLSGGKTIFPPVEWHSLLRRTGFSGVQTVFYDNPDECRHVHSCIVSRAVSDDFLRLIQPFAIAPEPTNPLLIIGGRSLYSSRMIDEIIPLLPLRWQQPGQVNIVPSIDELALEEEDGTMDVLCLQDVDGSLFAKLPISEVRLQKLQQLLMSARNLLWVTGAGASYSPRASMIRGVARVVPVEMPHLTMQVLGLEFEIGRGNAALDARRSVEALLRLQHMMALKNTSDTDTMLWTNEPEYELLAGGSVIIPRIMPDTDLDERHNAKTRSIVKTVDTSNMPVQATIPEGSSKIILEAVEHLSSLSPSTSEGAAQAHICVQYTIHLPSHSRNGPGMYLFCGRIERGQRDQAVLGLSGSNASRLLLQLDALAFVDSSLCQAAALEAVANELLRYALVHEAQSVAASRPEAPTTLLILDPEHHIAEQVQAELAQSGHRVYCASSRTDAHVAKDWIQIHTNMSKRMAMQCLPSRNIDLFVDCSQYRRHTHGTESLYACLPSTCKVRRLDADLLQSTLNSNSISLATLLENASLKIKDTYFTSEAPSNCNIVAASDLAGADSSAHVHQRYITDWRNLKAIPLTVKPLDEGPLNLLRSDRTYLLVGGSGGLGLSLCQRMIRQGARHLVITSRNPKVDPELQKEADRAGATVKIMAMDATMRNQVVATVNKVRETMPPIAGVCNLSMVLHDKMFLDMTARQLNGTLEAKVIGTEILDEIFNISDADAAHPPLDFFILTSSTASTVGNVGQANYHAANLFMAAVVERRRSRGLAASVIHIGWVADTGYVTRSDRYHLLEEHFRSMRFIPLSETDVQDAFAQAMRASKPQPDVGALYNTGSHDITMGLDPPTEPIQSNQQNKAIWVSNPRLLSLAPYTTLSESSQQLQGRGIAGSNIKDQVDGADTEEVAVAIVAQAFATKLETMLQLPVGSVQADVERPIIDLGIDSLVATEIRTWFLKDLSAEVSVVNILGGDTVLQICMQVAKKLFAERSSKDSKVVKESQEIKPPKRPLDRVPASTPSILAPTPAKIAPGPAILASVPILAASSEQPFLSDSPAAYGSGIRDQTQSSTPLSTMAPTPGSTTPFSADTSISRSRTPPSLLPSRSVSRSPVSGSGTKSTQSRPGNDNANAGDEGKGTSLAPVIIREEVMSAAQSRIWFASNHLDNPTAYNTAFHYSIQGHIGTARLRRALQQVANHHECLRTCFYSRFEDGHPMQGVMATSSFELTIKHADNEHTNVQDPDVTLQETLSNFKSRVWDLERGRTMAIAVLGRSATEHDLVIGYHHILMDGWSLALFLRDLDRAYRLQPLEKLDRASYIDYSVQQLVEERAGTLDNDLAFWRAEFEVLHDTLPLLPMARGLDRSTITQQNQNSGSHYLDCELSSAQLQAQRDLCQRLRISPFHLYLALFQVFLARMTNIEDLCVGVVDANRRDERFWGTVGCFVNMLPLRSNIPTTATFADIATAASRKAMDVFAHGTVPFDRILDQTRAPRTPGTNPLFQAAINYRAAVGGMEMWNLPLGDECRMQLSTKEAKEADNPYDISLGFIETQNGCLVQMWCLADLYGQEACRTMLHTYLNMLEVVARDPNVLVSDVDLHNAASVHQALQVGKGPEMDFDWPATLSERVQAMCILHANEIAVTDASGAKILYSQLSSGISCVAQQILDAGAVSGDRVAVLCEPSTDGIIAMLAILHIGGVYVPLDVSLPISRHSDMLRSCKPTLIICHTPTEKQVRNLLESFEDVRIVQVAFDANVRDCDSQGASSIEPVEVDPDAPAVLLFTSGSTGTPKGILLTQANFINHIALKTHEMGLQQECILQQSSWGFDMSLIQVFSALGNGGHLIIAGKDIRRDPVELVNLMSRESVSMTIATPTEYLAWTNAAAEVLQTNKAWRLAFSGGEPIPRQLKTELRRLGLPDLRFTNCYGPTEITAAVTFQCVPLDDEADSSCLASGDAGNWAQYVVGKALPNYSICVVDAAGHVQPCGHIGEICIGGAGVALGYLDQAEQTKAKFVADITNVKSSRGVMYRTGDRGRLLSDGTLLCLGRLDGDTQIKLRGQRIELQEVESALLRASEGALASAIVSLRDGVLVAHATLTNPNADALEDQTEKVQQILSHVKLPQAFVPATIRILAAMPTTPNGKLDRKAIDRLPLPTTPANSEAASKKAMEKMTVREGEIRLLWERVLPPLGGTRYGPSSDFFMCGGNSLLLMKLQKAINETTGVQVTTRQLYEDSTLRAMTHCVFNQGSGSNSAMQNEAPIDWEVETSVPVWLQQQVEEIAEKPSHKDASDKTGGIEVLLTGAASFLGGHLLKSLLQSATVNKVHCVAVGIDEKDQLPQDDPRVECYSGSLLSPTLGLTPQERKKLETTVHVIIHAGANGHCLNRFDSLRAPNLHSLHVLASLALPRSVPILFLSSSRVVLLSGDTAPRPGSLRTTPPATDGKDGYTASKWAGEVFLENLVAHLNAGSRHPLKVAVHRPCTLVSEQAPNSDAMNGILRYSLAMRCAPRLKRAEGYLDFGPLDTIIAEITAAALDLATPSTKRDEGEEHTSLAEIVFRHHSGGIKSPMTAFRKHLEKVYGGCFDELDMEEWIVRAGQEGLDPLVVAYIEALLESGMPMISPYMGEV